MPKASFQQRRIARSIANMIEQEAKNSVQCSVDDWNDYGAFQITVDHPEDGVDNLISLTPAIKRAVGPFDNVNLDLSYGGIDHPEKLGERINGKNVYRRPYTMVHIRVSEPA